VVRTIKFVATLAMTAGALGVLSANPAGAAQGVLHATALAAGANHNCAVTTTGPAVANAGGGVVCWGRNQWGQLGNGGGASSSVPVPVTGLDSGVRTVSAGHSYTCALTEAGAVWCWGNNSSGQLGNGTTTDSAVPVQVTGLQSGVVAISAGDYHACAITNDGDAMCWGQGRAGALGNGQSRSSSTPVSPVGLGAGVVAISAGGFHTCAILTDGHAKCWGLNANGQLGNGSTGLEPRPVDVTGVGSLVQIAAGAQHTCAIDANGAALCWGRNQAGQIGDATVEDKQSPTPVQGLSSGVSEITAGTFHSCATTTEGVLCWGSDIVGQFGNGSNSGVAAPIAGSVQGLDGDAHGVDAGYLHNCAITGDGDVQCWGRNHFGQLGNGTVSDSNRAVDVSA
jgi:alpha-tubulin suppressor-like RCC1 family protein